jgi:hypothetical protein
MRLLNPLIKLLGSQVFDTKNFISYYSAGENLSPFYGYNIRHANTRTLAMASSNNQFFEKNPLLSGWTTPIPPFLDISPEHYEPAFEEAMRVHIEEISSIATTSSAPTFDNTIAALDRAGSLLTRVKKIFHNLCSSNCVPDLQVVQTKMAAL